MAKRLARDVFLDVVEAAGVDAVFGNPGTFEQGLLDALPGHPRLKYVLTLQESVAVAMAMQYARLKRKVGFVQLHAGVGLGNGMGMLLEAHRSRTPLLVYVGENTALDESYEGFLAADLVELGRPVFKWVHRLSVADRTSTIVRRAIQIALTPPRGPVLLTAPLDVFEKEIEADDRPPTAISCGSISESNADSIASGLLAAQRPAILAGDPIWWAEAGDSIVRIAELLGCPIHGVLWNAEAVPQQHPLFAGHLTHGAGEPNRAMLGSADAALVVGVDPQLEIFPSPAGWFHADARVFQIDDDPRAIGRNAPVEVGVAADLASSLQAVAAAMGPRMSDDFRQLAEVNRLRAAFDVLKHRRAKRLRWDEEARSRPLHPWKYFKQLNQALTAGTLVVDESITSAEHLREGLHDCEGVEHHPALSRCLGVGLPNGVAAKLARPDKNVVAFAADGASMYTPQALWTAANLQLDVTFVIINNRSYRVLKLNLLQHRRRYGGASASFPFMDLERPPIDFVKLAESMGLSARRADNPEDFVKALQQAMSEGGPQLVEIVVDGTV